MLFQLKTISFLGKSCSIVCQNENGPCPLLAIANILILQRRIVVDPYATSISLSDLVTVVANTMIAEVNSRRSNDAERSTLNTVLQILPKLANGLDLNVFFSSVDKFEFTPEISVFDILGLKLFHGWLVDPKGDALMLKVMSGLSYTHSMLRLVDFKTLSDKIRNSSDLNRPVDLKEEEKDLIRTGLTIERFFNQSATQLTTPGLHALYNVMTDRQLAVFFRNNHFSTLFMHNGQLFNLVTDAGYLHEPTVVWEVLDGIDGSSEFYNASFEPLSSYKVSDFSPPPLSSSCAGSSYKSSYGGTVAAPPPSAQQQQQYGRGGGTIASPPAPFQPPANQMLNSRTHFLDTFDSPLHHPSTTSTGGGAAPSTAVRGTSVSSPLKGNVVAPASVISGPPPPPAAPFGSSRPVLAPTEDDDMRGVGAAPAPSSSLTRSSFAMQSSPVASSQRQLMRTASMDAKQFNGGGGSSKLSPTAASVASACDPPPGSPSSTGVSLSATAKEHSSIIGSQRQLLRTASKRSMDPDAAVAAAGVASSALPGSPSQLSPRPDSLHSRSLGRSQSDVSSNANHLPPTHGNGSLIRSASSSSTIESSRTNNNNNTNDRQSLPLSRLEMQQQHLLRGNSTGGGSNNGSGSGTPPVLLRDHDEVRSVSSGGSGHHPQPRGAWTHEQTSPRGEVYISRYGANSKSSGGAGSGSGSAASSYNESPMMYGSSPSGNNHFSPQGSPVKSSGGSAAAAAGGGTREHSNAIKTAINTIINSNSSALPSIINSIIDSSGPGSVSSRIISNSNSGTVANANTGSGRSFTGIANKYSYDDEDLRMNDGPHRAAQAQHDPQPMSPEEDEDYQLALRLQAEMNNMTTAVPSSSGNSNSATAAAPPAPSSTNTGTSPLPPNGLSSTSSDKFDVLRYGSSSQARGGVSPMPSALGGGAAAGVPIPAGGGGAPLSRQSSAGTLQKSSSSSGYNLLSRVSSSSSVKGNSLPVATNLTPTAAPPPSSPRAGAAAATTAASQQQQQPQPQSSSEFSQYLSPSELAEQRAAMEAYERDRRGGGAAGGTKKKGFLGGLFG